MTKKIKVIIKEPGEPIGHEEEIRNELSAFQSIVDGCIETPVIADGSDRIIMICNEDGKSIYGMDENCYAFIYGQLDLIFGTIIICGDSGDDFTDCPINLDAWQRLLRKWGN